MSLDKIADLYSEPNRKTFLVWATVLTVIIVLADSLFLPNTSIGYLYILPIVLAAGFLARWQLVVLCLGCTILREQFITTPWGPEWGARLLSAMTAFTGSGLFVRELARNRQIAVSHLKFIEEETRLRKDIERELQILVESSPAAILIVDSKGQLLLANAAAYRMLATNGKPLTGQSIAHYLPVLARMQEGTHGELLRTEIESTGRREDGEIFRAHLWVSTYGVASGSRLAAIVVDSSEELRDREESGLDRLLANSRILMGAVAHEVRNLCGAMAVAHANLMRLPGTQQNEDLRAMGNLLEGLRKLASAELRPLSRNPVAGVALKPLLDDLRIVIEPSFREAGLGLQWDTCASLPLVWADPQALLQVFLNLVQNAQRAMQDSDSELKELRISSAVRPDTVVLTFSDTGPGVRHAERLFRPFQQGSDVVGLGLYVSQAIARSFGGDLRHEPQERGATFIVELLRADEDREAAL